jgi:hypothetical protein
MLKHGQTAFIRTHKCAVLFTHCRAQILLTTVRNYYTHDNIDRLWLCSVIYKHYGSFITGHDYAQKGQVKTSMSLASLSEIVRQWT